MYICLFFSDAGSYPSIKQELLGDYAALFGGSAEPYRVKSYEKVEKKIQTGGKCAMY